MFEFNKVRAIGVTVPVCGDIPDSEGILSYAARVSSPQNQDNFETASKLLQYCVKHKHYSVFETCNMVMEIETPRDIARQILRHRSFSFQEFCIAEDSMITMVHENGRSYKRSIKELYDLQQSKYKGRANWNVRHYNEDTKQLEPALIKEIFKTGVKDCFEMTLESNLSKAGKKIKATADHKFLTQDGWKKLGDITTEDFVAENGEPLYRNAEWLAGAKKVAIATGTGVQGIADMAGISYHTARKWLKINNLQFTHNEVASYTEIWNKHLPAEMQPMFKKSHSKDSRDKMSKSARSGEDSEFYKNGNFTLEQGPFRKKVTRWSRGYLNEILNKQGGKCAITGLTLDREFAEVDHIIPVYSNPELAFEVSNLQVISREEHVKKTKKEELESRLTIKWKKVSSIIPVGQLETYDMEIDAVGHNYVANGIITHNSQRYAEVQQFVKREVRLQDYKNRQNSFNLDPNSEFDNIINTEWNEILDTYLQGVNDLYKWALSRGIAKEVARTILPEGLTMSRMYMNGTVRSWLHFIQVRDDAGVAQKEVVDVARKAKVELLKHFPFLEEVIENKE